METHRRAYKTKQQATSDIRLSDDVPLKKKWRIHRTNPLADSATRDYIYKKADTENKRYENRRPGIKDKVEQKKNSSTRFFAAGRQP